MEEEKLKKFSLGLEASINCIYLNSKRDQMTEISYEEMNAINE